jgi:ABC-type nitrate/sulfonate/bicarbonate transport system ATPase subunit
MLKVENVSICYGSDPLMKNLSLTVGHGESVTLIGSSGSGKSSLLKACVGLLKPQCGLISIDGIATESQNQLVTYLMQEDLLLPWRTVLDNVRFFAELGQFGSRSRISIAQASSMLAEVGLAGKGECYPHELSGGMRQRVALARALLQERPLLLLDEPFSALDVIIRENLYLLLRRLQQSLGRTLLMVTHDFYDAIMLSDRILLLGEGGICGEWEVNQEVRTSPQKMGGLSGELRAALRQAGCV